MDRPVPHVDEEPQVSVGRGGRDDQLYPVESTPQADGAQLSRCLASRNLEQPQQRGGAPLAFELSEQRRRPHGKAGLGEVLERGLEWLREGLLRLSAETPHVGEVIS